LLQAAFEEGLFEIIYQCSGLCERLYKICQQNHIDCVDQNFCPFKGKFGFWL